MIILYRGARGRGKTLSLVKDAKRFYNNKFTVYTNMSSLSFGKVVTCEYILNLSRKSELKNCVLVIDEIELFFDSRQFGNKENKAFSGFLQQIRKRNVHILCTCQYIGLIDIRIRQQLDFMGYPHFDKKTGFCKIYYFDLTRLEDDFNSKFKLKPTLCVFDGSGIFPLYDTNEMLDI